MYYKVDPPKNEKNKQVFRFSNFGFPTILLTFDMICIMTFGVLALVTANSDLKLSRKVAEKTTGYYKAEEESYSRLSELSDILTAIYKDSPTEDNFRSMVIDQITNNSFAELVENKDASDKNIRVHWDISITDTQVLSVTVRINNTTEISKGYYTIEEWVTKHTSSDNEEISDTLHLINDDNSDIED